MFSFCCCNSGVAHNGVETIDVGGQDVLILGTGPIGLLAAQCAAAAGICYFKGLQLQTKSNIWSKL